ncbi:MAG TPA: hypothetical protein VI197_31905 [Polyangiaceae bacterium]
MLVVNPWHWLNDDGTLPHNEPRLLRRVLRVAQVIEYGGTLKAGEMRETLLLCNKRPKRKPCGGLIWVIKTPDDSIVAFCMLCKTDEMTVHHWQDTEWAAGVMKPVRASFEADPTLN